MEPEPHDMPSWVLIVLIALVVGAVLLSDYLRLK